MFSIRPDQIKALEQAALRQFEDEMVAHSKEFAPRLCEVIGDEQLRVALRRAMDRAGRYRFTLRGPIRLYIEMMFLFGSAFDTDPQYPWAAKILRSLDDQMQRAETLCAKILDYQEKVSGPEAANTRRALTEVLAMTKKPLTFPANDFVAAMRKEMHHAFPQKAGYIGEEGVTALIREGSAVAKKHCFPTVRGDAVVVVLMFAFGHGCTNDPLYPWIERTLKDDKISTSDARAERLEKKALTWLEHVLARPREGGTT